MNKIKCGIFLSVVLLLSACSGLPINFEQPEVHLVSIKPLASENLEQRFALGLRITNPNAVSLPISGLSYAVSLQGHKVLSGAVSSSEEIPAFGNSLFELESATSLLGGLGVLTQLLAQPESNFEYSLQLKVHSSLWFRPITLVESGEIAMDKR